MLTPAEHQRIQDALADLAEEAKQSVRGSEHYRATIILRATHLPDGDVIVTDDAADQVLGALLRRFPELRP